MGGLWKVLVIICLGREISGKWENFTEEVYSLAKEVSEKYFEVFKCVTYAVEDVRRGREVGREVPRLVIDLSVLEGEYSKGGLFQEAFEQGCGAVIVQAGAESRGAVARALVEAKKVAVRHRYNRERYLFLPVAENDTSESVLGEEGMYFLPNLVLVVPGAGAGTFVLKGHSVFGGRAVEETWSRWRGFEGGVDLYPDKTRDVNGKQLVFGVMHYQPYSVIVREGNKTIYDGLEARMAKQFVEMINGTFHAVDHSAEGWGDKFPNGSGNGIFGSVLRNESDVGYSAFYQWYCDILDCTYPYIQAEVIGLAPKPGVITSGMTILLPFAISTWIAFLVAYLISCTCLCCITLATTRLRGAPPSRGLASEAFHSAYNIFRLQLNQVPRIAHGSSPFATFLKVALLYHFLLSLFWQGGIASILTVPRYEKPIDTAEDLVSRWPTIKWGADDEVWIRSIENTTEPILHDFVKKFLILDAETLIRKTRTRHFATFVERLPNKHYGFSRYVNEETVSYLRLMKSHIYTGFAVMILPKASPYTEKLDHVIHWLFDTGITRKMELQVSLERINNHLQIMIKYSGDGRQGGKAILTVGHIKGPLYIYFAGTLVATAAFVAEKLFFRKKRKRRVCWRSG